MTTAASKQFTKILPTELLMELVNAMDPASAIVFLFADKSLFDQEIFWHNIASTLQLDAAANARNMCLKWFKIHRHCLQLIGGKDAGLAWNNWRLLRDARAHYRQLEVSIRAQHSTFKLPLEYLEWLSLMSLDSNFSAYHTYWDWYVWQTSAPIRVENHSLWLAVATYNDKHDIFLNCDTRNELYGCTVDCYDTELEDESWNNTWHNWLAAITSDRFFEVYEWEEHDYRRTCFGERIVSFEH